MQNHLRTVLFPILFAQVKEKVPGLVHPWAHHHGTYLQVSLLSNFHVHAKNQIKAIKIDLLWERSPVLTVLLLIITNESLGVNRKSNHGLICFTIFL